jgi:putative inorganic carbon (HCO3(-)) transporter
MNDRRRAAVLVACAVALALLLSSGLSSARTSGAGWGAVVADFQNRKSGQKRLEKPNPTPLWSLYPLREPESPGPAPPADTDALSPPPVKATERPEGSGGAVGAAERAPDEDESASLSYLVPATLLALIAAFGVRLLRRRSRASRARSAPATATAPARPRPPQAADSSPYRVPVNGTAHVETASSQNDAPTATPTTHEPATSGEGPRKTGAEARTETESPAPEPASGGAGEPPPQPSPGIPPATREPLSSPPAERASQEAAPGEPVVDREPVRVHLLDGRVIVGYTAGHYSRENRVLLLDVERVVDAGGREIPSTPLDSFLVPPQIDRIEVLGPAERRTTPARPEAARSTDLLRLPARRSRRNAEILPTRQRMDSESAPGADRTVRAPSRSLKERLGRAATTVLIIGIAATVSTLAALSSDSKAGLVLPLVIAAGMALGLVALTRFVAFVEVLLVARASLDLTKLTGVGDSAAPDAGARAQDPASLIGALFLVAATLWLLAQRRRNGLSGSPVRRVLVFFMAAALLSVLGTVSYAESMLEVLRVLAVVMMFAVLEELMADPKRMERLLRAAFLSAVFPLAFTTLGFVTSNPRTEVKGGLSRILGTFNQSNSFGRYLMLILVFGVAIYPYVWRPYKRGLIVLLPLATIYLALTYTLSAVIASALGLVVVAIHQSKRLLVGLVVVGTCLLLLFPSLGARFAELGTKAEAASFQPEQSTLEWRLSYWADVFPLAKENPVTGIGLGTTSASTERERAPHNDFLRAYVETGMVGFVAYISLLISLILLGRRAIRVAPIGTLDRGVAVGFMGCAVAYVAVSVVANIMSNVATLWYFVAFAAAASSVVKRRSGGPDRAGEAVKNESQHDIILRPTTARG